MTGRDAALPRLARPWRLLAAYGVYVLAVLWPEPQYMTYVAFRAFGWALPPDMSETSVFLHLAVLYAALPALIFFGFRFLTPARPGGLLHTGVSIALHLYLALAIFDLLPTLAFFSFQTGTTVSTILWTLIFMWANHDGMGRGVKAPWFRLLTVLALAAFTLWSAGSIWNAATQAIRLAGGLNFCIATTHHAARGSSYGPIDSIFDLRGTNLYTPLTGYKSSSRWYRHAVLIAWRADKYSGYTRQYWYWSISLQKFIPYNGESRYWVVRSDDACTPRPYFLFTL